MPDPVVLIGALLAGFVQGLSGFALGLVASVFWTAYLPPTTVAPLIVICSLAGQFASINRVLPSLDRHQATPLVLGGIIGTPLGVLLLPFIDPAQFRLAVGILLSLYCPAMLLCPRLPTITWGGRPADAAAGFIGGLMGGIAGLNGPAPTLWLTLRRLDRDAQRALMQVFLIAAHTTGLIGMTLAGLITADVLHLAAWLLPCAIIPSWLATRLYTHLPGNTFRRLVLALLMLTGLTLVVQAW